MPDQQPTTCARAHRNARAGEKTPMSGTKKALIALLVLALILVGSAAAVFFSVRHSIDSQIRHVGITIEQPPSTPESSAQSERKGEDINFLIMGSDSRQSGGDPTDWQAGAQRSDVLMLVQITGDKKGVNVMSIPRDSWVDIPGHGQAKINAAFSYGGASLAIQTVENLMGVHIDHFMVTDFTSFEKLTDSLGGVEIATAEGVKTYSGEEALAFVRERYHLPRGDFDRVQRQQAWIRAIFQSVFSKSVLTDPGKLSEMISIITQYSALDDSLNFDSLLSLASGMTGLQPGGVKFFTAPFTGTGTSDDGQSIVVLDTDALAELSAAWNDDRLADYLVTHQNLDVLGSKPRA